jgi:subtilisin family serine protease
VRIINLSYTSRYDDGLKMTFDTIKSGNKILIVAAAGNDYGATGTSLDEQPGYFVLPAMMSGPNEKYFLTVGALDGNQPAAFSQRGHDYVDLFAPGTCIRSFGKGEPLKDDISYSGTSQAAPIVSFSAAMLLRFGVPLDHLKDRLLDTVDASKALADISISGGSLNLLKALDFLDDIVVFNNSASYEKGKLVAVVEGTEQPYQGNLCSEPGKVAQLRNVRRAVFENGEMNWVSAILPKFSYAKCTLRPNLHLRLKATSGDHDFTLADIREIIPQPSWAQIGD